jgi:ABC-type uncharacterized transport system involved in gliding motility auxiliary subunit
MLKRVFSAIGWIGSILVFIAVGIRFLQPVWDRAAYWTAWAGLILVLLYLASQWRELGRVFSRRQARYGSLAATSILAVLGILVAVNYLAAKQDKRWDLTANQQFSLSPQTHNVLKKLDGPLKILVFARQPDF